MPKRTNDFQKLILLLNQQLAPEGSKVTESNMVYDAESGELREVDITISLADRSEGGIDLCIECRDHRRSQTVSWIDELIGKYVNRQGRVIVAVSSSGFSLAARRKASHHNILTLTLNEATDISWLEPVRAFPNLRIDFTNPALRLVDMKLIDKSIKTEALPPMEPATVLIRDAAGVPLGSPLDMFDKILEAEQVHFDALPRRPSDGLVEYGFRLPPGAYFTTPGGLAIALEGIFFIVDPQTERLNLDVKAKTYDDEDVAVAFGSTASWRVQFVVTKDPRGRPRLSLSVQPTKGTIGPGRLSLYGVLDEGAIQSMRKHHVRVPEQRFS